MSHVYRRGKLGESLIDALETLIEKEKITGELATQVLTEFDKSMADMFENNKEASAKSTLNGKLDVYRYIDNVWTFVLSDASLRVATTLTGAASRKEEADIVVEGPIKLVLVDAKIVKTDGGTSNAGK